MTTYGGDVSLILVGKEGKVLGKLKKKSVAHELGD